MSTMKKLIALVLALVCVLILVGCVSENNDNKKRSKHHHRFFKVLRYD